MSRHGASHGLHATRFIFVYRLSLIRVPPGGGTIGWLRRLGSEFFPALGGRSGAVRLCDA